MSPADMEAVIAELVGQADARHIVVQFDRAVRAVERERLAAAGLNVLGYLDNNAFLASLSSKAVNAAALGKMDFLSGLQEIEPFRKLHPAITAGHVPDWAVVATDAADERTVAVYVLFHTDVSLSETAMDAVEPYGAVVRSTIESINGMVIELPLDKLDALADEDVVRWIEWPLPPFSELNDDNRTRTGADVAQAPPYELDGSGVVVLVYDSAQARETHVDFEGRLTIGLSDTEETKDHATHVACTIGGAGTASDGLYRGMAPGVTMVSYGFEIEGSGECLEPGFLYTDPGDLEADYAEAISLYDAVIANNSIGAKVELLGQYVGEEYCVWHGDYGVTANLIDTIVRGDDVEPPFNQPFRSIWATGNERPIKVCDDEGHGAYYSMAPPANAKNHITVGAVYSDDESMTAFSSWGPTDDGRIKPDVVAPGHQHSDTWGVTSCSAESDTAYMAKRGTSMSSPTVCGLAALLLEDFRDHYPATPDPRNSTLKALFANTAVDLGNKGPDYQFGFGSVRVMPAIESLRTGSIIEQEIGHGDVFRTLVVVEPEDPELRVTLAWDDVPAEFLAANTLVNDLDLVVLAPSLTQHFPWTLDPDNPAEPAVRTQADHVNNIEQVAVDEPVSGPVWIIEVHGTNVPSGPQAFSLVASAPLVFDCNENGTDDHCDVSCANPGCTPPDCGTSADCDGANGNGIPDECEPDCNENTVADSCDLARGDGEDCNDNELPDDCEPDEDCNNNGVQDICDIAGVTSHDCNENIVPDECDIAGVTSWDCNGNTWPDECECESLVLDPPQEEPDGVIKNRYLSFSPGNAGCDTAIELQLVWPPQPFEEYKFSRFWLGPPFEVTEFAGEADPEDAPGWPTFYAARLQCEPHWTDWGSLGVVHMADDAIIPGAIYQVYVYHPHCGKEIHDLVIWMGVWGDVVGECNGACTPPDGTPDFSDVLAIVDKFTELPGAISKTRADIAPAVPDFIVNFDDIMYAVSACRVEPCAPGESYPSEWVPTICP